MSSTALDDFDSRHDGAGAPRWHIDSSTLQVLEHVFSIDQFPNVDVRNQLGTDLNVTPRQIQVWFQNRRQRERKRRDLSRKKRTLEGTSPSKGSSTAATLSSQSLSSSSATLCASSEDISSALLDDYDEVGDASDGDDDADAERHLKEALKKRRGIPLAPMPRLPHAEPSEERPIADVETSSVSSGGTVGVAEGSPARAAATSPPPAALLPSSLPEARPAAPRPAAPRPAGPLPGEGEYDWQAAMRTLLPHAMGRLGGANGPIGAGSSSSNGASGMGGGGMGGGGMGSGGMGSGGTGSGGMGSSGTGSGASIVQQLQAALHEQLAADLLLAPSQSVTNPLTNPFSMPSVAARLAAACQSSLLGRTLQQYGGVVQSITDAAPPYRLLSVSSGWQSLTGYHREEVLGRSMGFLQGPRTQRPAIAALMEAVRLETPISVRLTNYNKAGLAFTHQLSVEPLKDPSGLTRCFQATSLILQGPGEAECTAEVGAGQLTHLPHLSTNPLPPLWPLLGLAVRPDAPCVPSSGMGFSHSSLPSAPPMTPPPTHTHGTTRDAHGSNAGVELDDDDSYLAWLQTDALPCSSRESACGDYGADAACSEERRSLIINGLTNDDMQMVQ
jgi:PAS domain S-box-containing protein